MRAMAILADRGIGIVLSDLLSVDAGDILLANFVVASGAVHFVGNGFARSHSRGVYLRMALAAGNLAVAGVGYLVRVDIHGLPVTRAAQLLVGVATHAVCIGHPQLIEDVSDLVRLMAIRTGGQHVGLFFPELATNHLAVYGFDLRVALGAGIGNILTIDRRSGIGMRQDRVRGVASGAGRGHGQPLLQQRLAVNALGVISQDIVLGNLAIAGNGSSFLMALAADEWYFQRRHRRVRIFHRKDVVVSVTGHAVGCERIAARNRLPVERFAVQILLAGVAGAALYGQRLFVRQILTFEIGVAAGAAETGMDGTSKFLGVDIKRNGFAASRRGGASVAVTGETFGPRLISGADWALGKAKGERRGQERHHYNSHCRSPLPSQNFLFRHVRTLRNAYFNPRSVRILGFSSPEARTS